MTSEHTGAKPGKSPQVVFRKVGECLYRLESTGGYYALVKRGGKQFRRSLKTADRKLADRRLPDLRQKVDHLTRSGDSSLSFDEVAKRWVNLTAGGLKPRSLERRLTSLKGLGPFFRDTSIRSVTRAQCERWPEVQRRLVVRPSPSRRSGREGITTGRTWGLDSRLFRLAAGSRCETGKSRM